MDEKNNTTIHSIDRAIDIIEFLYQNGEEASISEISAATGLYGSTIHRVLSTLKSRGYIYQNKDTTKYWIGLRFYSIGVALKDRLPLVSILEPLADEIAKKYSETIYVAIPSFQSPNQAQQTVLIKVTYSPYILRTSQNVGTISLSHGSATGKCMMAYYPQRLLSNYRKFPLPRLTEKTITDWTAMDAELEAIRERGYAVDSEEEADGLTCIAVPLLDTRKNIVASMSLSGPTVRLSAFRLEDILADLQHASEIINNYL